MENGFRGYHPFVAFCYYVCSGILILYYNHPVFSLTALILLIFVNITHDHGKTLKKWMIPLILMGLIFVFINPLLVSRGTHILFYIGNRQITLEATMFGIVMSLTLVATIILFVSFNLILNGNKFLYVMGKMIPQTAFLVMLSLRFVPLLHHRYEEIAAVQRVRGMSMAHGTIRERAKSGMNMIQTLLTWSLEEAIQTADSMKARGYGSGKKSSFQLFVMEKRDWFWFFTLLILFSLSIAGGMLGYGQIIIYPELGTLHFYLIDWLLFLSMIVILSFPLIVEGIEKAHWTFYK